MPPSNTRTIEDTGRMSMAAGAATRTVGTLMALAVLAPVAASAATPLDLYYERTLMSSAQSRGGLGTAPFGAALEASAAQARGAALRAGADMAQVRTTAAHAVAKIDEVGCASPGLKLAAPRVRSAFEAWTHVTHMTFPGEAAGWKADRTAYRSAQWKLVQPSKALGSPVQFGMAGRGAGEP